MFQEVWSHPLFQGNKHLRDLLWSNTGSTDIEPLGKFVEDVISTVWIKTTHLQFEWLVLVCFLKVANHMNVVEL